MGGGPAAAVAALAPAPLALVATGQSDLLPPAVRVTTNSKDSFLFVDEIDNPANLMSGATDLAFVVVFVYPLVILAMAFNLLAGEREQGTLAVTLASARRPGAALAGKLAARVSAPIIAMLLAVTVGVWVFAGWARLATPGFAALLVVVLLYGLFWAALAATVDGLGRSSAFNALTLIGAWVTITMVLPAAINSLAAFAHPAPSRIDMVLAARAASTDADRARDASLARYADEHGGGKPAGGSQEMTLRRLATQEAAFQRVEAIIAEHDAQLSRQREMAERLGYLSPAYLTYQAMADIAGAGEARYRAFLDRIRAFHVDWREFFLFRAKAGASLTAEDYAAMPKFTQSDEELTARAPAGLAGPLIGVVLPTLLLAAFGAFGYRRAAPR
jgi:ABC-2 type transport system permease protein